MNTLIHINEKSDLLGNSKPFVIFYPMVKLLSHLMSCELNRMISRRSIAVRRIIHPVLIRLASLFLKHKQVFESKNALLGINAPDKKTRISEESVIWCSNHGFKDDVIATLRSARHAYILFGSLPIFFNTFDGISAYINGVVMCNRKEKQSKAAAVECAKKVLSMGTDIMMFPEGVWNKMPDKLLLNFWPGIYRIAKENNSKIVPVIHYLSEPHKKFKGNVIHTVVADPISLEGLNENEGLQLLRDTIATWYFLMMEKYGKSTRQELLAGFDNADDAWEEYISMHTGSVRYYDREIELCADYRPKDIDRPENVWQSIANIRSINAKNIAHVLYAQQLVEREKRRDFQRRF